MKIKRKICMIVGSLVLACNATFAGQIYSIDPTQSWVSAYVPSWIAFKFTPYTLTGPGFPPTTPSSTVIWDMSWTLANFQLSGIFQGSTEVSPWAPSWAHLTMSNGNLQSLLPSYVHAFILPSYVTYSVPTGNVFQVDPCGISDPFYYPSLSGSCWYSGGPPSLAGTFKGNTLELTGGSGALAPFGVATYTGLGSKQQIANPGPPPSLDAIQYPTQWASYHVVANAVPEPGTFQLIFLGMVALYQVNRRKLTS